VVSARPGDDAFVEEIQNTVRSQLAQHEYPRQVVFVPELPKTPAGKIHRRKLREQELAAPSANINAATSPDTPTDGSTDAPTNKTPAAPAAHV